MVWYACKLLPAECCFPTLGLKVCLLTSSSHNKAGTMINHGWHPCQGRELFLIDFDSWILSNLTRISIECWPSALRIMHTEAIELEEQVPRAHGPVCL